MTSNVTDGSHRAPDGTFRNPWPDTAPPAFRKLPKWWLQRLIHRPPPDPSPDVFEVVEPRFSTRVDASGLAVTWIGHATALIQIGGVNVLTDPMFSRHAAPLPFLGPRRWVPPGVQLDDLPPLDAVLLTHSHYDHLDAPSVRQLARRYPAAPWVAPLRLGATLTRFGVRQVHELDWWDARDVAGLRVTATPAQHFSARTPWDRNETLWCGFALQAGGRHVFFAGDSGYHPAFVEIGQRLGPFDAVLLPIGAYEPRWFMRVLHMNPEEAVRALVDLDGTGGSGVMVAIHWGTFKLTDEPMDEPPRRAVAAWEAVGLPPARLWVPRHGETRAL